MNKIAIWKFPNTEGNSSISEKIAILVKTWNLFSTLDKSVIKKSLNLKYAIWKFPLSLLVDVNSVQMPKDATILHVGEQEDVLYLWAACNTEAPLVTKKFAVVGTGHPLDHRVENFIGTVQQPPFVWHVFEVSEDNNNE